MQRLHRSGAGPARARYDKHTVLIILVAICVVIRGRGGWLGTTRHKGGGSVAGTLARPEAGRMVIRDGHKEMSERVESQGPDIQFMRLRKRCTWGDLWCGR
jgi:hypothetical protein